MPSLKIGSSDRQDDQKCEKCALELTDLDAAREEAGGFARDLMRREPDRRYWAGCIIRVTNETGQHLFDLPFLEAR
jgi:Domain of unknown function (DUF6894)